MPDDNGLGPKVDFTRKPPPGFPTPLLPVCPYCGTDPATVASVPFSLGPLTMLSLFCANRKCRRVLAIQLMGVQEPSRLVVPGRPN